VKRRIHLEELMTFERGKQAVMAINAAIAREDHAAVGSHAPT
jgi:hypothetical protein